MKNWVEIRKGGDFKALGEQFHIDPVIARLLINRGIKEADFASFLSCDESYIHRPQKMLDMEKAVNIVSKAVKNKKKIRIIGDYDIDGINATYILYSAIGRVGGDVSYAIPRRIEDGYGINPKMVDAAHESGVEVIITCDNGISAFPAVNRAKELGMTIVITDHHQIPFEEENGDKIEKIVPADAVVDPHRRKDNYPFPEICGGMVAWKFMQLLYERMEISKEEADAFIENAAFATVGDIMPLLDENRIVVKRGLLSMTHTKNVGLRALIAQSGLENMTLTSYHLGFVLGPCLNATGRLETADLAMQLLLETDYMKATAMAGELVSLNTQRKALTKQGDEEAMEMLSGKEPDDVLVLYLPTLHESLCGLVAGHMKEKFYRPTFVLSDTEDCVKGSGRSIEAYSMFEKLNECKDLLLKFGGHPMAAGLSLKKENVDKFREFLNAHAKLSKEDLKEKVYIDIKLPLSYLSEGFIEQLNVLEPFGNKNEKPSFADKNVTIKRITYIGKETKYLKFTFVSNGRYIDGLYFGDATELEDALKTAFGPKEFSNALSGSATKMKMSVLYYPQINEFRGNKNIQIVVKDYLL